MTHRLQSSAKRASRWSEVKFREVYSRYIRPVRAFILKRVRNHHDAEDLAAQVFAQALKNLDQRDVDSPELASWLFTAAKNISANHQRSAHRLVATLSIEDLPLAEVADEPADEVIGDDEAARLSEAIRRLPEEKRRAVVMRFVDELTHNEIAEELGRTEGSARVLLHRAISDLRKEVS